MASQAPRKRTRTRKVEQVPNEKVELTVEEPLDIPENKYQPKKKVGSNTRPKNIVNTCLLYTSPSPRDGLLSRMPSSA